MALQDGCLRKPFMEIIPAIDLLDGACVRLLKGDYEQVTRFSDDPVAQALSWQHKVPRDFIWLISTAPNGANLSTMQRCAPSQLLSTSPCSSAEVCVLQRAQELLACGLDRVILGTVAIEQPELVRELSELFQAGLWSGSMPTMGGSPHAVGLSKVMLATDLARQFSRENLAAIISTDIATDGTLAGPNLTALREIAEASHVPVIARWDWLYGRSASLLALEPLVSGVIVGRALYDGRVDLSEAIRALADDRLQDVTSQSADLA